MCPMMPNKYRNYAICVQWNTAQLQEKIHFEILIELERVN